MRHSITRSVFSAVFTTLLLLIAALGLAGCATAGTPVASSSAVLVREAPPANGDFDQLFVLHGDAARAPITSISLDSDVRLPAAAWPADEMRLRIVSFNDLHDMLTLPSTARGDTHLLSQMVRRVREIRATAASNTVVLFVSSGDDHTGSAFDELVGMDVASYGVDPSYHAYSQAGLDAAVVGNHELDRGARLLAKAIATDARFPVLSANLSGSRMLLSGPVVPAVVAVQKGLRIALIGLTTPDETVIRAGDDPGLKFVDPVTTLDNLVPALEPYADVFVILSHVGYNGSGVEARHDVKVGDLDIAKEMGRLTRKPSLVLGGHTHTVLNLNGLEPQNLVSGVPVFQSGGLGQYYGDILLTLRRSAAGIEGKVADSRLVPLKKRDDRVKEGDPRYAALEHEGDFDAAYEATAIAPLLASLKTKLTERIGVSDASADITTARTFADRYTGECAIANFMNDAVVARSGTFPGGKVDVAVFNASGVASGVPTGSDLTFNDLYSTMPYADVIFLAELTGAQLKDIIRSNARRMVRPEELQGPKPIDTSAYVSRGYLHFSRAVRYTAVMGASAADADAVDISINGAPIEEQLQKTFRVVFSSYIAGGGEGWSGKPVGAGLPDTVIGVDIRSLPKLDTGLIYRNEIIAFTRSVGGIGASTGALKDGRVTVRP